MEKFAFIIHPLDVKDVSKKFSLAKRVPDKVVEKILPFLPPFKASQITGIASPLNQAEGRFIGLALTSKQIMTLPVEFVLKKIVQAGKLAEQQGAKILGLGAFTSVVGDAGLTVAKALDIPVTTGNSYTVFTAVEGVKRAAAAMDVDIANAKIVVVGAAGSIGSICAQLLAKETKYLTLAGRNTVSLKSVANKIMYNTGLAVNITNNVKHALKNADIVLTVTSSIDTIIEPEDLKSGAVVCDVSRPRDVSKHVAEQRKDVLVIEGGLVEVPGNVQYNINFGAPEGLCYACMAETMILALEQRYESFTLGREMTLEQVETIGALAAKHGFKLAGFRSFQKHLTEDDIQSIKQEVAASAY